MDTVFISALFPELSELIAKRPPAYWANRFLKDVRSSLDPTCEIRTQLLEMLSCSDDSLSTLEESDVEVCTDEIVTLAKELLASEVDVLRSSQGSGSADTVATTSAAIGKKQKRYQLQLHVYMIDNK